MRGKAPPFCPWWIGDYREGTAHLTPEQRYVYSELLWRQWSLGGRLPTDPKELRQLARAEQWSMRKFRAAWDGVQAVGRPAYEPKFAEDERGFFNPRLDRELEKAGSQSEAGRKNALRRWGCPHCRASGKPMKEGVLTGEEAKCPKCKKEI